ncbi:hypothetical protein ACFQX7_24920 [Luedemannella flava]
MAPVAHPRPEPELSKALIVDTRPASRVTDAAPSSTQGARCRWMVAKPPTVSPMPTTPSVMIVGSYQLAASPASTPTKPRSPIARPTTPSRAAQTLAATRWRRRGASSFRETRIAGAMG